MIEDPAFDALAFDGPSFAAAATPARMVARLKVMRLGASRLGYVPPVVIVRINGVTRTAQTRIDGLSIQDYLDGTPNTATVRVSGFTPTKGHEIKIGLGDLAVSKLVFAGHILRVTQVAEGEKASNVVWDLECISYEWLLNRRKVTAKFQSTSATTIVTSLMSTFTSGFTTTKVEAGLEALDEITFTNEEMMDALDRVARRIGAHWVVDYGKTLYFGVTSDGAAQPISTSAPNSMGLPHVTVDLSQVRPRISVEGAGSTALAALVPGDTLMPVGDVAHFNGVTGGTVAVAQNKITYTALDVGGSGAIVGVGVSGPTNALTSTAKVGTGLGSGYYKWKTTFGTAAGETLGGPESVSLLIGGTTANPTSAPTGVKDWGGNLSAGTYQWKMTYNTSVGETLASPATAVVTMDAVADPQQPPTISFLSGGGTMAFGTYDFKYSLYDAGSGRETLVSGDSNDVSVSGTDTIRLHKNTLVALPSGMTSYRFYRKSFEGGGGFTVNYRLLSPTSEDATYYYFASGAYDLSANPNVPATNTAVYRKANLSNLPISPDPDVSSRNLYRTSANGSTFRLLGNIGNNTQTAYADNTSDGALGGTEPGANTSVQNRANLTNVATSPDPAVTSRKIYRTPVNSSTFKYLATIGNNTATVYGIDNTPDGSLGANEPTSNTSGLTAAEGTLNAGSSTIPVSSTGDPPFHAIGGWVRIQSQVVKYTGKTSTTLTGVPPAGSIGALTASVKYGTEILAAPMLTGIPASGPGSIVYAVVSGEPVNLVVTVNDLAAQAAMTTCLGSSDLNDGIFEEYLQDNRLSETEARNRAQARLNEVKDPLVTVSYPTRDSSTRSGREVSITLDAPWSVTGTYKIQSVTISQFDPLGTRLPLRTVEASSRRFRLEDYLRLLKAA